MNKKKTAIVLEGGGMRGAYTSGALSWLIDNNIEFDNGYGISTGAVHLCNFLMKKQKDLHDFAVYHIANKKIVGILPFIRSLRIVDYYYLFRDYLPNELKFDISPLKDVKCQGKVGVYECEKGRTEFVPVQDLHLHELQAATTLPLIGKIVKMNENRHLLDGGITEMIPVNEAIKDGCTKQLIIATKPKDYVRKPAKKIVAKIMKLVYPKWLSIGDDYEIRHLNYQKQIKLINELEENKSALYISPSKHSKVTRLGGTVEQLEELFQLGYSDMEAHKEEILKLLK